MSDEPTTLPEEQTLAELQARFAAMEKEIEAIKALVLQSSQE